MPHTPLQDLWNGRASADALQATLRAPADALPVPPATDRSVWNTELLDAATLTDLLAQASTELGEPWPTPLATQYADYVRQGDRATYEDRVFARQTRLAHAVLAAAITGADQWFDEVANGLTLLCEQSTWCWSAHEESFHQKSWLVPDVTAPVLDLGAGEVAALIAWTDHILGAELDERFPGLRTRMRHEVRTRILDPYLDRRDWWWINERVNNWNPWICGNVLLSALVLCDAPSERGLRARIVAQTIADVDHYVASLPADGAVDEGVSYWWQGACRLLEMLDVLKHATDGDLDATGLTTLRETLAYLHRMHLGSGWYLNVADGSATLGDDQPWDVPHRWAIHLGDDAAREHAAARGVTVPLGTRGQDAIGASLGRIVRAVTDGQWTGRDTSVAPQAPEPVWLESVQISITHADVHARRFSLAVKGGHNAENHNHNDVGSVVVAVDGLPLIVDPGRPNYTRQTFSDQRYELWPMQSQWHSTPVIARRQQSPGEQFTARQVRTIEDAAGQPIGLELDLAAAYGLPDDRWIRRAVLGDDGVHVTDSWRIGEPGNQRIHWMIHGSADLVRPGTVRVQPPGDAAAVLLTWDSDLSADLDIREVDDPVLTPIWGPSLTRLVIHAPGAEGETSLRIAPE